MAVVAAAEVVVAEDFQYAAVGDATAGTFADHAVEFGLEFAQHVDAAAYVLAVAAGDGVDLGAGAVALGGQIDQLANLIDGESEFPGMADEMQALAFGLRVAPLAARGAGAGDEQALLLVVAQGLDVDAGLFREPADREGVIFGHADLNLQRL